MRKTNRGFRVFSEFRDSYGSTIRVQESSSAEEVAVWIFCKNAQCGRADPLGAVLGGAEPDFTPHLNVAQAKRLRSALDRFIAWASPETPARDPETKP